MRSLALAGMVVVLLGITALVSPTVTQALVGVGWHVSLPRVYDRVFEILLVIGVIAAWRRLDLGRPEVIGLRHPDWRRDLGRGIAIGVGGLAAGLLLGWLAGGIVPKLRFAPLKTVWKAALGFTGAVVVGVGEETLFRGILLRRFRTDVGRVGGVVLSTAIYAVVHALRTRGSGDLEGPWGGVLRTAGLFAPLADPHVWPSVAGLAGLGILLAVARLNTGSLWTAIGIHSAWVAVFRVGRLFVHIKPKPVWVVGPGWPPLIGGAAGALALAVSGALLWRMLRQRSRGRS